MPLVGSYSRSMSTIARRSVVSRIRSHPRGIVFCIAALGLTIVPRAANAIGACVCFDLPTGAPRFTRDIPLNARIFASVKGADPATLRLMQGSTEVPIKTTDAGGAPYHLWVEPLSPLLPGTTYSLGVRTIANPNAGVSANEVGLASMETVVEPLPGSAGHDVTPPSIGGITFAAGGLADNCGPVTSASTMKVASYRDDLAIGSAIVLQLDLDMGNGTSKRMFVPHPGTFDTWSTGIGIGGIFSTGSDCLGDLRIPDAKPARPIPCCHRMGLVRKQRRDQFVVVQIGPRTAVDRARVSDRWWCRRLVIRRPVDRVGRSGRAGTSATRRG